MEVLEELKVKKVIISKQGENSENFKRFKEIVNKKNMQVICAGLRSLDEPQKIQIEKDLYFEVLWPDNQNLIDENVLNNNSMVTKLHYKSFSCLFTGDIEEIAEKQILQEYKNTLQILNSTVLKIAHHGSKTSSTKEFIEAVKPKISLIGVGENNKFGHPNDDVIARLESIGSKIYRTDKMGEISIIVSSNGKIKIKNFINCD